MTDQFQGALFGKERQSAFEPVPSITAAVGDHSGITAMPTQDRYRVYQSYKKDMDRVDAGGAPRKRTARSYDHLRAAIGPQFASVTGPGAPKVTMGKFEGNDNYPDAGAMNAHMRAGHINVNATTPQESTVAWSRADNDKFRVMHDMIGHGSSGASFSPAGESITTQVHRATMPAETHHAITAEVLGQATHYEFNGGQFVDQKGLYSVPRWAAEGRSAPNPPKRTHISRAKQGRLF